MGRPLDVSGGPVSGMMPAPDPTGPTLETTPGGPSPACASREGDTFSTACRMFAFIGNGAM